MDLIRTEQIRIESNDTLSNLCHLSKNLYNEANYIIRQEFFTNGKWIRYYELDKMMQKSENYKTLPSQSAQQTIKILDKNWKSFFEATKDYKKHPEKHYGIPKLPNYKYKDGEFVLIFTNQRSKIKDGNLIIALKNKKRQVYNRNELIIKTRLPSSTNLREVRIIPQSNHYVCEIVYKKLSEEGEINKRWYAKRNNQNRIIGIDLGLRNVVTIANNIGLTPIIIKGGVLKSVNQYYNKKMAKLHSIYAKQGIKYGSKMDRLNDKRYLKIKDVIHKISRFIIDYSLEHNIGAIVIGKNDNWKQHCDLGKKNNQNFVDIPFNLLTKILQYKAEEQGIVVKFQEESHTSKCSFLDSEPICHQEQYKGTRFRRGLFRSATGIVINSDVNGALNIIRKAFPNAFPLGRVDEIEDVGLHPISVNPLINIRNNIL